MFFVYEIIIDILESLGRQVQIALFKCPEDTKVWALLPAIAYLCLLLIPFFVIEGSDHSPLGGTFCTFSLLTSLLYGKVSKSLQGVFGDKVDAVLVIFLPLAIIMLTYEPLENNQQDHALKSVCKPY